MEKSNIIKEIISIPARFYSEGNISFYSLLKKTGYFELYNQISEVDIFEMLKQDLECITQWLSWSEDKRVTYGWYFKESLNGNYIVGHFPPKEDFKTIEYSDVSQACSVFIKREIEDIRKS